jgi:GC-rich sequence DNA-binding factor
VKERRQRLRKTGQEHEEDYVSLSVTKVGDEPQGPHPESRLMREEDDLGDGDDGKHTFSIFKLGAYQFV